MSTAKEPLYWRAEAERLAGTWQPGKGKYRTIEAYATLFEDAGAYRWRGESSHYLYSPAVAPLIARQCPDSRIVVSLRDPAERLFSEYLWRVRSGKFEGSFEIFAPAKALRLSRAEVAASDPKMRLGKGLQAERLAPWLEEFGSERVMTVLFDDLRARPDKVVRAIYRWLEVDDGFAPRVVHTQKGGFPRRKALFDMLDRRGGLLRKIARNAVPKDWRKRIRSTFYSRSLVRPVPDPEIMELLRAFYRPDVERLEELIGRDLSSWKAPPESNR